MEATSLLIYALKSTAITIIVWLVWYLFLRNLNRFSWMRAFLLNGAILSALLPLLIPFVQSINLVPRTINPISAYYSIPEIVISPLSNTINWINILIGVYLTISGLFVFRFIIQLYKLVKLTFEGTIRKQDGVILVEHNKQISPFSFLNFCYINKSLIPNDKLEGVILHEKAHFIMLHSVDILLFEVIGLFLWFNPFYWMLRKALVEVHEYQADKNAINSKTDPYAYLDAIVSIAFNGVALPLGNNFNKSLTLKRLAMISITKPSKRAFANIALALIISIPLIFAISCESSNETLPAEEEVIIKSETTEAKANNEGEVFVVVEEMPLFEGQKSEKFREFIAKNLKYPQIAQENGIQGKVFVSFIVETDGSVSNVKIVRGVDPSLDQEAKRVVESSPKWTPGKQRGQAVRTTFTFPIIFQLQ